MHIRAVQLVLLHLTMESEPQKTHAPGKIDIHGRAKTFENALIRMEHDKEMIPENREIILSFLRACQLGKTVLGKSKKRIGVSFPVK